MPAIVHTDPAPTLDDVWRLFREHALQQQENDRQREESRRENDRQWEESRRATEHRAQEFDRELKELRQLCKEQNEAAEKRNQEAEKRSQETDRRFRETDKLIKNLSSETDKKIGELGNRLGQFVEGFVAPAAVRLFKERNIEVTGLNRDMERNNPTLGIATQVDLLAINGDSCVVIEVKSKLDIDDVNDHLERMTKFKLLFPEYKHHKIYGAVASMVIPKDVARYAYRKGFFVIGQTGETVKILNDEKFKPVEW